MAIHVEDHPIDYASFEGEIPAGEYGGGKVETWDRGTWEPLGDPDEGMRKGYEPVLKKTRWCVVKRETKLTRQQRFRLRDLLRYNLQTVRAHLLKEESSSFGNTRRRAGPVSSSMSGAARSCVRVSSR